MVSILYSMEYRITVCVCWHYVDIPSPNQLENSKSIWESVSLSLVQAELLHLFRCQYNYITRSVKTANIKIEKDLKECLSSLETRRSRRIVKINASKSQLLLFPFKNNHSTNLLPTFKLFNQGHVWGGVLSNVPQPRNQNFTLNVCLSWEKVQNDDR